MQLKVKYRIRLWRLHISVIKGLILDYRSKQVLLKCRGGIEGMVMSVEN